MPTGWRIVKKKHEDHAFSGEGARLFGGRWNSPQRRVVYAADSVALAALELLVHMTDAEILRHYSVHAIHFADRHLVSLQTHSLGDDWRSSPAPHSLKVIGDAWLADQTSVALAVPSAVVPIERNYLINPEHPDFASLTTEGPLDFSFDTRLAEVRKRPRHQRS